MTNSLFIDSGPRQRRRLARLILTTLAQEDSLRASTPQEFGRLICGRYPEEAKHLPDLESAEADDLWAELLRTTLPSLMQFGWGYVKPSPGKLVRIYRKPPPAKRRQPMGRRWSSDLW